MTDSTMVDRAGEGVIERHYLLPEGTFAATVLSGEFRRTIKSQKTPFCLKLTTKEFAWIHCEIQVTKLCQQLICRGMRVEFPRTEAALSDLVRELISDKIPLSFSRTYNHGLQEREMVQFYADVKLL